MFDTLIVHRLSRLARNTRELLNIYNDLREAGVGLRSVKEGFDFNSTIGKVVLTVLAAIAELERETIFGENVGKKG